MHITMTINAERHSASVMHFWSYYNVTLIIINVTKSFIIAIRKLQTLVTVGYCGRRSGFGGRRSPWRRFTSLYKSSDDLLRLQATASDTRVRAE